MKSPFVFDDISGILQNSFLRPGEYWKDIWWGNTKRFVPNLTLAWQIALTGYETFWLHLGNLVFHLLTVWGVWELLKLIVRNDSKVLILGTSVFALHPLQTQAVNYLSQRSAVMAGMFYVWACVTVLWSRTQDKRWVWVAYIFALFAFLSKENSYTLVIVLPLLGFWKGFIFQKKYLARLTVIFGLAIGAYIFSTFGNIPGILNELGIGTGTGQEKINLIESTTTNALHGENTTPVSYFITQTRVMAGYWRLVLLMGEQSIDHEIAVSNNIWTHLAWFYLVGHIALIAVGIRWFYKKRIEGLGILWFYAAHVVESSVFPIRDLFMEHRMYIPMIGVAIIAGSIGEKVWVKNIGKIGIVALVVVLSIATWKRNNIWTSDLKLWEDAARKAPNKVRAQAGLGEMYAKYGMYELAEKQFLRALALAPERAHAYYNNLGLIYLKSGQHQEALESFDKALLEESGDIFAMGNKAGTFVLMNDIGKAVGIYQDIIRLEPKDNGARKNLAIIYSKQGEWDKSYALLQQAIDVNKKDDDVYVILGELYRQQKDALRAVERYKEALKINKYNDRAYYGMGVVFLGLSGGQEIIPGLVSNNQSLLEEARKNLEKAVEINKENKEAWRALVEVYKRLGREKLANEARANLD